MNRTRAALVGVAVIAASLSLGAHAAGMQREAGAAGTPPAVEATAVILYSQLDNAAGNGAPDQNFETAYDAYDCFAADDFVVPAATTWSVTRFNTVGTTGGLASSLNVVVHSDTAGAPGAAVCTHNSLVPTSQAGGSFVIDLPVACVLATGHYWIDIQANQDFGTQGQHFWSNRTTQSNSPSQWKNPGDGFATGCTNWTSQQVCGVGGGVGLDFLFSVEGTIGGPAFAKGDFNADGLPDLVFRNVADATQNKVWFMDGVTRTSEAAITPNASSAAQRIRGTDDFDSFTTPGTPGGDGVNDLVFWNQTTGAVEFWAMNGINRPGAAVPLTGATALNPIWDLSATGDFNADGRPDLVWRNFTSQKIVIWKMGEGAVPGTMKTGNIIPTPDLAVNANWIIVAAADYNNDTFTDFLWYNFTSGKIVTWYMNASVVRISGQFTTPDSAGNNNWKVVASSDYSRNYSPGTPPTGSADIVWRNDTSGNQVVWHLDFNSTRVHGQFTNPVANPFSPDEPDAPLDWVIVGPR